MIKTRSSRACGLLLAAMTLWSLTAYAAMQVCPVHDAPETVEHMAHGAPDEQSPADGHDDHDCQCAGHCSPASGDLVSTVGTGLTLALVESGLVSTLTDYLQPTPVSDPWLLPPANGPPAA